MTVVHTEIHFRFTWDCVITCNSPAPPFNLGTSLLGFGCIASCAKTIRRKTSTRNYASFEPCPKSERVTGIPKPAHAGSPKCASHRGGSRLLLLVLVELQLQLFLLLKGSTFQTLTRSHYPCFVSSTRGCMEPTGPTNRNTPYEAILLRSRPSLEFPLRDPGENVGKYCRRMSFACHSGHPCILLFASSCTTARGQGYSPVLEPDERKKGEMR